MEELVRLSANTIAVIYWGHRYPRPEHYYMDLLNQNPEATEEVRGQVYRILFYHHVKPEQLVLEEAETMALINAVNKIQAKVETRHVSEYWA